MFVAVYARRCPVREAFLPYLVFKPQGTSTARSETVLVRETCKIVVAKIEWSNFKEGKQYHTLLAEEEDLKNLFEDKIPV